MSDQQRIEKLIRRCESLEELDEQTFQRVLDELNRVGNQAGYDDRGRLKVAMFDAKTYDIESFDEQNDDRFTIHPIDASLSLDTVPAAAGFQVVCVFVNDHCDAPVVDALAQLGVQMIALRCAGYNNVDLEACERNQISVVRVPAYSPYAVAEHTIALMLMLNRKLHQAYQRNRIGYFVLEGLIGFDMKGKTVGVIGTGKIGRCTIDILMGLGCRVLAFDKSPHEELSRLDRVEYVDLEQIWSESDIITLHLPLFPETYHLINEQTIGQMKKGVMLINTSRGGLVDAKALINGLKSRQIGAAGLDVYEEEAGIFFHDISDEVLTDDVLARLMTFNNVVVTSHQAFLTREALANIAETTLASIGEFAEGKRQAELSHAVSQ